MAEKLTHIDEAGSANMVDVAEKARTTRIAVAESYVKMQQSTLDLIVSGNAKKGDVISIARIAGIMAAKKTHDLIPLCHPLALTKASIDIEIAKDLPGLRIEAVAKVTGQTGVEMEALTAASVAALTVYDMAKAVDRGMEIGLTRLIKKSGGQSGDWTAEPTS